jgi:hypothetical protein
MTDALLPRWLIVVRRDKGELYEDLRRNFKGDGRVRVILDRRERTRRTSTGPMETERRRSDRRKPVPVRETTLWEDAGFRLFHRDEDMQVYER